jgi:hypothetical protein
MLGFVVVDWGIVGWVSRWIGVEVEVLLVVGVSGGRGVVSRWETLSSSMEGVAVEGHGVLVMVWAWWVV